MTGTGQPDVMTVSPVMSVNSGCLRDAEPGLRLLAGAMGDVMARLITALDAEGTCWGADQVGTVFAESYLPATRLVREALALLHDDVQQVGDVVIAVADAADAADGRARARF